MPIVSDPQKLAFSLIHFKYGKVSGAGFTPQENVYLTSASQNKAFQGNTYISNPSLDIKIPSSTGLLKEDFCNIRVMRENHPLFSLLTEGVPTPLIHIKVIEVEKSLTSNEFSHRFLFSGSAVSVTDNIDDTDGLIEIRAKNWKSFLENPMGIITSEFCQHTFGKGGCKAVIEQRDLEVGEITGNSVVHIGTPITGVPEGYFIKGFLAFKAVSIDIADWQGNTFLLKRRPPASWLGETVVAFGGCNQTLAACQDPIRDQEENFLGVGKDMPVHNPLFEIP